MRLLAFTAFLRRLQYEYTTIAIIRINTMTLAATDERIGVNWERATSVSIEGDTCVSV